MLIRYNGHRPEYKDALYDTGMWISGQVKEVPDAVAHKMTKHADVYSGSPLSGSRTGRIQGGDCCRIGGIGCCRGKGESA